MITKKVTTPKYRNPTLNPVPLDSQKKNRLRNKLLGWYSTYQRDLPWRRTKDPYAVWVSEVMLQQTQVQTVVPYYLRFVKLYPSIKELARAETQDLLRIWAGLGYYSRARNLQRAAREIIRSHRGKFPQTYSEVLSLPGIGPYTAGAILSIAFDLPYPVLDGNVTRVLTRVFGLKGDPKSRQLQKALWQRAEELVSDKHPGNFNQAVMELGAVVCVPRRPFCVQCPWQSQCQARKEGIQDLLPEKRKAPSKERVQWAVAVLIHRGRVLIVKRTEPLLRDFWEFPGGQFNQTGRLRAALARHLLEDLGMKTLVLDPLVTFQHVITHRHIRFVAFQAELAPAEGTVAKGKRDLAKWVRRKDLGKYPFASASQKIIRILKTRRDLLK